MVLLEYRANSHVFKTVEGLELTLDAHSPEVTQDGGSQVALIHFHGGFFFLGQKSTFPPYWLINVCRRRSWTYVTPSYRLLPEATGQEMLSDAVDAFNWVSSNISQKIIVAGSSAGGYLAFHVASQASSPRPMAVLSVYGMNNLTDDRYTRGTTVMGIPDIPAIQFIADIEAAKTEQALSGYDFPLNPSTDKRFLWATIVHQQALFPELLTGIPNLGKQIKGSGMDAIPAEARKFFSVPFKIEASFPPTALVHGSSDRAVNIDQSTAVAGILKASGVKVHLEVVEGKDHGFDAGFSEDIDVEEDGPKADSVLAQLKSVVAFLDDTVGS
ncbi:Alpha/Beta hydrolase protein [Leptodontidium sp. MPI-SDFR-AT-0119]|nr:Alpha/Beta hydrolase protein [Leptodontidium sp. MPI-SDFR-AT-0119]